MVLNISGLKVPWESEKRSNFENKQFDSIEHINQLT